MENLEQIKTFMHTYMKYYNFENNDYQSELPKTSIGLYDIPFDIFKTISEHLDNQLFDKDYGFTELDFLTPIYFKFTRGKVLKRHKTIVGQNNFIYLVKNTNILISGEISWSRGGKGFYFTYYLKQFNINKFKYHVLNTFGLNLGFKSNVVIDSEYFKKVTETKKNEIDLFFKPISNYFPSIQNRELLDSIYTNMLKKKVKHQTISEFMGFDSMTNYIENKTKIDDITFSIDYQGQLLISYIDLDTTIYLLYDKDTNFIYVKDNRLISKHMFVYLIQVIYSLLHGYVVETEKDLSDSFTKQLITLLINEIKQLNYSELQAEEIVSLMIPQLKERSALS